MTREEAMFWLNDRLGKSVHVSVLLEQGDSDVRILEGEGTLRHVRSQIDRADLAGWCAAGETRFDLLDLTEIGDPPITFGVDEDEIEVSLGEGVKLQIIEQRVLGGDEG